MADQIFVQVRFSKKDEKGVEYQDALYFSEDEWKQIKTKPEYLELKKTERFEKWKENLKRASETIE